MGTFQGSGSSSRSSESVLFEGGDPNGRERLALALEVFQSGEWEYEVGPDRWMGSPRHDACFGSDGDSGREGPWGIDDVWARVDSADRARVRQAFEKALKEGGDWRSECRVVWPDGSLHWIQFHGRMATSENGDQPRMYGFIRDITEQRLAESHRQMSEARMTTMVDGISDGFVTFDREWRFTYLNERGHEILEPLQTRTASLLGKRLWQEFPDLEGTRLAEHYRRAVTERVTVAFEFFYPPLDAWLDIRAYPTGEGLSVFFQDISEKKRAEIALNKVTAAAERERRLFEAIHSSTPDLIFVFDLQHRFTYANEALLEMWGKRREEALGKTCLELGYEPWHAEMHDRELDEVVATQKEVRGEVPFEGTYGRRIYDYIFVPVVGEDGEVEAIAGTTRDVTVRKEAEEKLVESRQRLKAALEGSGAGMFRWDIRTDEVEFDANLLGFLGRADEDEIRTLSAFLTAVHPEDQEEFTLHCERCRAEGADFSLEFRIVQPDGTITWLHDKGKTVMDDEGNPLYMTGICLDITARKLSQRWETGQRQVLELIAENAPLSRVFEAVARVIEDQSTQEMFVSVLTLSEDGQHLRHGAAPSLPKSYNEAIDGVGIGPEVGSCGSAAYWRRPVYVADIANDPRWEPFRELALAHGLRACWSTPILADSNRQLFGTFAMYYPSPRNPNESDLRLVEVATRIIAIAMERKQSEEALRASAERLEFMAESMPQKIFSATVDGELDYVNRQWLDYTGCSFAELLGSGWLERTHPDERDEHSQRWAHAVSTGETFQFEHRVRGGKGKYRWHLSRAQAMRDKAGNVVMWIGSNTDIDVARRNLEEISRISRAKDHFLATLSHELRTPLTPVLLMSAALENDSTLSPKVRKHFSMIRRNVELEARLIDDLLDLTRISRGKLHLERASCDVHHLAEQCVDIVGGDAGERGLQLTFSPGADRHCVSGDATRLQQVLWNLLKNAIKFTPAGGSIHIKTENDGSDHVVVTVEDTGIGILPEELSKVFKAFEQGAAGDRPSHGGLGLGLAISRAVVEAHGGEIWAESEGSDRGTRVVIRLATIDPPDGGALCEGDERACPPKLCVLLVEDHEVTREGLRELLGKSGHEVTAAASVAEALQAFGEGHYDLVISDLGLPDGSGLDLMREIRSQRAVPSIAFTGYGTEDDVDRALKAGFSTHLVKPIKFEDLRAAIQSLDLTSGKVE